MYYRIILPIILKNLDNIFYIDADVICINNACELFNIDFKNKIILAITDTKKTNDDRNSALKLQNHVYFNSGVLGINVKKWNDLNIFDKFIKTAVRESKKLLLPDQDVLNMILLKEVKYLPRKFNWFNGFYKWEEDSIQNKKIILLHFTSTPKPWDLGWKVHSMCNKYNADLYNNYEMLTPWANTPLEVPNTYKKMRLYARDLKRNGYYLDSIKWYLKYLKLKLNISLNCQSKCNTSFKNKLIDYPNSI